jgi:hypothetical protein
LREVAHEREGKALSYDGRCAQCGAVALGQPVHPREHEAGKGSGQRVVLLVGGAHQLLEKQRVAGRALDALAREVRQWRPESARERERVFRAERSEVDRQQRTSLHGRAPRGGERIPGDA